MSDVTYASFAFPATTPVTTTSNDAQYLNAAEMMKELSSSSTDIVYSDVTVLTANLTMSNKNTKKSKSTKSKPPARDNTAGTDYANVANIATVYPEGSAYVNMTQVQRPPNAPSSARPARSNARLSAWPNTDNRPTINGFNLECPDGDPVLPRPRSDKRHQSVDMTLWETIKSNKLSCITTILFPILVGLATLLILRAIRGPFFFFTETTTTTTTPKPTTRAQVYIYRPYDYDDWNYGPRYSSRRGWKFKRSLRKEVAESFAEQQRHEKPSVKKVHSVRRRAVHHHTQPLQSRSAVGGSSRFFAALDKRAMSGK